MEQENIHLLSSEQSAMQIRGFVHVYSTNVLGTPLDEHPSPNEVVSDFISDLTHFASMQGSASEVLARSFQNYLEEISAGDISKEIVDRFRAFIDDAIHEVTIGS